MGNEGSSANLGATSTVTKASWLALLVAGTGMGFDAYVINLPVILLPLIADTYHTSIAVIASIQSLFLLGYLFGTIGFNAMADYIGRRLTLELSIIGYTIVAVLGAFAPTAALFAVGRAVTGFLAGGEQGVGAIYACEAWPDKWRGFGCANMFSFYPPGVMLAIGAGIVITPTFGWRGAFVVVAIMGALIYLLRRLIFKSSRFSAVKEKRKQDGSRPFALRDMWENRSLRRPWLSLLLINLGDNFNYHGMSVIGLIWLRAQFHLSTHAFFMILLVLYGIQTVQCVIGAYLIDVIGRRPVGIFCAVCAGIGVPLMGQMTNFSWALAVMICSWCLWLGPGWGTKMALNPEVFPTEARGTGMALTHGLGRIAGVLGPLVESVLLVKFGAGNALIAFAFSSALIVVGYLLAPELARKPIPDLVQKPQPALSGA